MLFSAKFADNTFIEQTETDISAQNSNKSSFFDVLEKEKNSPLEMFCLTNGNLYYLLDLRDGRFEVNEQIFYINKIDYPNPLRLIYYVTRGIMLSENGVSSPIPNVYNIGFQTNDINGNNIKQILTVNEANGAINFIV